jgi:hypothetical protein
MHWRSPTAWTGALLLIASLAVGAPLAMGAVGRVATLLPRSAEPGYLLYPHQGLCAPSGPNETQDATPTKRRSAPPFRPTRTAHAVMPPELGEGLGAQWLEARSGSSGVLEAARARGE